MKTSVFIHIGYFKTGTKWLQTIFFPSLEGIVYSHKTNTLVDKVITAVRPFDFIPQSARQSLIESFKNDGHDWEGSKIVISRERLCGHPKTGGHDARVIADRLRDTFPDSQIIIFIRNQTDAIESSYKQYVKMGGTCSFRNWIFNEQRKIPGFSLDYFCYHKLISYYQKIFGSDKVHVFLFETLSKNPVGLIENFVQMLDTIPPKLQPRQFDKVNRGYSPFSTRMITFSNRFTYNKDLNPCPAVRIRMFRHVVENICRKYDQYYFDQKRKNGTIISPEVRKYFHDYYKESNRILEDMLSLRLGEFGYFL